MFIYTRRQYHRDSDLMYFPVPTILSNIYYVFVRHWVGDWSHIFVLLSFCYSGFCKSALNFNLGDNFKTARARALRFHVRIPSGEAFPLVSTFFYPGALVNWLF